MANGQHPASDQENLDAAAVTALAVARNASFAAGDIQMARDLQGTEQGERFFDSAYQQAKEAADGGDALVRRLIALGARRPGGAVARDSLSLEQLTTPAAKRYQAALEEAAAAAADLYRERGWVDADGQPFGEAETLAAMAAQLRIEIHGPEGRGRE